MIQLWSELGLYAVDFSTKRGVCCIACDVGGVRAARSSWVTPQAGWTGEADTPVLTVGVDSAAPVSLHMVVQSRAHKNTTPVRSAGGSYSRPREAEETRQQQLPCSCRPSEASFGVTEVKDVSHTERRIKPRPTPTRATSTTKLCNGLYKVR